MDILEFRKFLAAVCRRIPNVKKLRNRIYNELYEHMEDMLDGFLEAGEEEEAAIQRVVKEMGDPRKISKAFRRAHRREIISAIALRSAVNTLIILVMSNLPFITSGFSKYRSSVTKEHIESVLAQSEYDYTYYGKVNRNGRDYIFYIAETPEEYKVLYFESIKLFNRYSIYDRFAESGYGTGDGNILLPLGFTDYKSENEVLAYFGFVATKVKYFKLEYEKYDYSGSDNSENILSDFIAVPNVGEFTVIDIPEGYRFSGNYCTYDENKQLTENREPDDFSIGQSFRGLSINSYKHLTV